MPLPWEMTDEPATPSSSSAAPAQKGTPPWESKEDPLETAPVESNFPTKPPSTRQDIKGSVSAAIRGLEEAIPGMNDVWAARRAYIDPLIGGPKPAKDFTTAKRDIEEEGKLYAREHPKSYVGGQLAGAATTALEAELLGAGALGVSLGSKLLQGEQALAKSLVPYMGTRAEANLAARGLAGAGLGAAQGAVHGLGSGVSGEERVNNALREAGLGAALGPAGALLGHGLGTAGRYAGEKLGFVRGMADMPTTEYLKKIAQRGYKAAEDAKLTINSQGLNTLHNNLTRALTKANYSPRFNPVHQREIEPILNNFNTTIGKHPGSMSLNEIHQVRQTLDDVINKSTNPRLGYVVRKEINDFLHNLNPKHAATAPGYNKDAAVSTWNLANSNWNQFSKLFDLDTLAREAKNASSRSGTTSSFNDIYRNKLITLLNKVERGQTKHKWHKAEVDALREAVHGGKLEQLFELGSKLSPLNKNWIGPGTAALAFVPNAAQPYAASLTAAGLGSQFLKNKLLGKTAKRFRDIVNVGEQAVESGQFTKPARQSAGEAVLGVPTVTSPIFRPNPSPVYSEDSFDMNNPDYYEQFENPRGSRASGGRLGNRDYPAKRLSRVERAAKRAMDSIALETKPLMNQPDQVIADALKLASQK